MAIFNSYVTNYHRVCIRSLDPQLLVPMMFPHSLGTQRTHLMDGWVCRVTTKWVQMECFAPWHEQKTWFDVPSSALQCLFDP